MSVRWRNLRSRIPDDIGVLLIGIAVFLALEHSLHGPAADWVRKFSHALWLFWATAAVFTVLERIMPGGPHKSGKACITHLQVNALYLGTGMLAGSLGTWLAAALGHYFDLGLIDLRFATGKGLIAYAGSVVLFYLLFDFFYYWLHRFQHVSPILWQQHKLHHMDEALTAITTGRQHWLEEFFRVPIIALPMAILFKLDKIDPAQLGLVGAGVGFVLGAWSIFIHANLRLHLGWLGKVFAGPQIHRVHHSRLPEHHDRNFAAFFPIWDNLFGTFPLGAAQNRCRPTIEVSVRRQMGWGLWAMACSWASIGAPMENRMTFAMNPQFLTLPSCMRTIGEAHGDIAVSPDGDIYVSVEAGDRPGIQVYSPQGHYLRNVPDAPYDLHGFIITAAPDGTPNIYGVSLFGQRIVQMTLQGMIVQTIGAASIPDRFKTNQDGKLSVYLTGIAVGPNGDIYAVDGYGRDFIHRFDKSGRYLTSFGGQEEPWNFKQCHKIAIDSRFKPARLICTDRLHDRLIHMDLEGKVLGVFAEGLRWPSGLAIFQDELAVAELGGRVSILDLHGKVKAYIGANDNPEETKTNRVPPEKWRPDLFYAPHGVAYDTSGNLWVTEWSQWGRVVRVSRQ